VLDAAGCLDRFTQLLDERDLYREALVRYGAVIDEPVMDTHGEVIGHRVRGNPAEGQLRRCDRALNELADRLALSPASRARLGVTTARGGAVAAMLIAQMRGEI
jgi:phage terminase small subunit